MSQLKTLDSREMTPKAGPWLLLTLVAVVVVVVVLLFFGSGSILNFLRKLTVHYAIEWSICAVALVAVAAQAAWNKINGETIESSSATSPRISENIDKRRAAQVREFVRR